MIRALVLAAATVLAASAAQAHSHKLKRLEIVHPWCIEIEDTELVPENLDSVDNLTGFLARKGTTA